MTLRRTARLAGMLLVSILAFAVAFPLAYALGVAEQRGGNVCVPEVPAGQYRVLVADWGYHTAIILEQPRGWSMGPIGEERAPFLEYAWGELAHGRYLWTRNCNWWTVKRLAPAALAGRDAGVVFAGQVAGRLHGFQAPRIEAPST